MLETTYETQSMLHSGAVPFPRGHFPSLLSRAVGEVAAMVAQGLTGAFCWG
jgi:hypothetical protein